MLHYPFIASIYSCLMQTQADDKLVTTCEANDSVAINNNYSYYGLPKTF